MEKPDLLCGSQVYLVQPTWPVRITGADSPSPLCWMCSRTGGSVPYSIQKITVERSLQSVLRPTSGVFELRKLFFYVLEIQACHDSRRASCMIWAPRLVDGPLKWRYAAANSWSFRSLCSSIGGATYNFVGIWSCDWTVKDSWVYVFFSALAPLFILQLPKSSLRACGSKPGDHCSVVNISIARPPTHNTALGLEAKSRKGTEEKQPLGQSVWEKSLSHCFSQLGDVVDRSTGLPAPALLKERRRWTGGGQCEAKPSVRWLVRSTTVTVDLRRHTSCQEVGCLRKRINCVLKYIPEGTWRLHKGLDRN